MANTLRQRVLASCTMGAIFIVLASGRASGAQLSVGIQSDMSQPTMGLHQPTSSHITYNDRDGMNVQGGLSGLLGPPIKIAQGFNNMVHGGSMAGMGQSLKAGGAVLGVDAKLLEAAGGAKLLKGGLLAGGAAAKVGVAKVVAGLPGKKIASVVELPVKVIAMKDLVTGKGLLEAGRMKVNEAQQAETKGEKLIHDGNALKSQGITQIVQGATEGIQNIGNHIQQTTGDAVTALKLLPIMFEPSPSSQSNSQQPQQQQQQQYQEKSGQQRQSNPGLTGGSLFGGLGSLIPGLGVSAGGSVGDPFLGTLGGSGGQHRPSPFANLFGAPNQHNYAAVLNASNPLTSLLLNPSMNPFLLPINGAMDPMSNPMASTLSHPFGQTTQNGGAIGGNLFGNGFGFGFGGGHGNQGNVHTQSFNLFPGLKYSERISVGPHQSQQHQVQEKTTQQQVTEQQQQQQVSEKTLPQQQQVDQTIVQQQQQQQQQLLGDGTKKN